jgi:tetratricopeptide (TPR) repeat protein
VILAYREGVLRLHRGQLDQAGALARDVMPLAEEVDNFVLPQLYALEAELAIRKGDLDEASRRASAAAEATADKLGAHHPDAIEALRNLASVQSWQGDEAAALVTLDEAMKRQAVWGDEPSLTLVRILDARGTALYNLRRFSEAAETLETVRQMATELDGAQTWRDSAEVSLARAQVALERPEEAAVLIEGFLAREGGEDVYARSLRADAGILYATVLMELGRPQEAVASLPRVQGWVEAAFGDEGIDRVQAAVELADVWIQSGDPDSALRELERFLPLLRDEPMWRGKVQRAKAAALRDLGRLDEARDWARRSLASFEASTAGETEYHLIRALLADLGIGEAPGVQ